MIKIREKEGKIPSELCWPIYLKACRRRYKRAGANRHYSNVYDLVQALKKWYDKSRCKLSKLQIKNDLCDWYKALKNSGIEDFKPVVKMLRKHEYEVLNYFSTNAQFYGE